MAAKIKTPLSEVVDRKLYIMGMSRKDLMNKLQVSSGTLSLCLSGRMKPTIEMSNRIAAILDMDAKTIRELALKKAI